MTEAVSNEAVGAALKKMRTMLAADGYELDVAVEPASVRLTVSATAVACAECLVPKSLFASMAADALKAGGVMVEPSDVSITYPADSDH